MDLAVARAVLADREQERAITDVERFVRRRPHLSREELSKRLIRRTALRCAAVGAIASVPSELVPRPVALDLSYQTLAWNRLALAIAHLNRRDPSALERAVAGAASLALAGAAELAGRVTRSLLRVTLARPRLAPARPWVGMALTGALRYGATLWLGIRAREVFEGGRRGFRVGRIFR
jgi:hypothetical protein